MLGTSSFPKLEAIMITLDTFRRPLRLMMFTAICGACWAQTPSLRILLPERTRLLENQQVDLVLEVRNAASVSGLRVMAGAADITGRFAAPVAAQLDCDASSDWVLRANLQTFDTAGTFTLTATATAGGTAVSDTRTIRVQEFNPIGSRRRNVILFIGDAMGTAYRDAARLVSRAIVDNQGKNSFREGVFDNLLEMDKMPVSGMSMTYGSDSIVPDSANTGSAWATGNKSYLNAVNVFGDGTDCRWRFNGQQNAATLSYIVDNPRVENLWQYLKRRFGYQTGIVSTAAITDATPAVEGAYTGFRQTRLEIARQYRENPMLNGQPAFDVMLGGGADPFTAGGRAGADRRNLIAEFQGLGYQYVKNATELRAATAGPLLGLFKGSAAPATSSNGIGTGDFNMDVAYDKLGLQRPASEGTANLGAYTDQPMLDLMTEKAINALSQSRNGDAPFILMVEAASIDKQSHPNHAAGTIWDAIEFDKAIGVARTWAAGRQQKDTLVVVTADHDQSMSIIGVSNIPDAEYFDAAKNQKINWTSAQGAQDITIYGDAYSNARAGIPMINGSTGASNNGGTGNMPGSFRAAATADKPETDTYSTYFGTTAYRLDARNGYPANSGAGTRRLAVGFRSGDHTGSSVPVTAEGPGALMFTGYMDQTDIFFKMAMAISSDTSEMDKAVSVIQANTKLPKTFGK
jgi:alkaline phosphatase